MASRNTAKQDRRKISAKIAADVEFLSDRKCCVCQKTDIQIHHLDGNPSNNDIENLALLCLNCHHAATVTGGLARKLSAETIRKYRKSHHERIARQHKVEESIRKETHGEEFELYVQAVEVSEIRKIRTQLAFCKFKGAEELLKKLYDYWMCGQHTRLAILEALSPFAQKARHGLTTELSKEIHNIASNVLPSWNPFSWAANKKLKEIERAMFAQAEQFGFVMAYDGALYLKNLSIVNDGGFFLWSALRVGHAFDCKELVESATQNFDVSIDAAERGNFPEAQRLLRNFKQQATQKNILYPELDLELFKLMRPDSFLNQN